MVDNPQNPRRRIVFFHGRDAGPAPDEMMPREGIDEGVQAALVRLAAAGVGESTGAHSRLLFREPGEQGMSLLYLWFKSGYVLPFHSHSSDCLYYVVGGELRIGASVLRKGDGMFIPADHGYGYEAGPDGVEVLEFRNATRFNLFFRGNDQARWDKIVQSFTERAPAWETETVPPSER